MRLDKLPYILLSIGVGTCISIISALVMKRKYEQKMYDEINKSDKEWDELLQRSEELNKFACQEVYELRRACEIMLEKDQCDIIFEQVRFKLSERDKTDPESRGTLEEMVKFFHGREMHVREQRQKEKDAAREVVDSLGYSGDEDIDEIRARAIKKVAATMDAIETHMAEQQYPDDDGEGEIDDFYPLGPDGDILDEYHDERFDDEKTWTTDAGFAVSGDDIVKDKPYVISEWQFTYGRLEYEKVSLEYLAFDDTVLDEDDTELDQSVIGPKNLRAFETDDCDSIFIRNDQLQIDYEIMWTEGSYIHDILGYPESEIVGRRIYRSWEKEEQ